MKRLARKLKLKRVLAMLLLVCTVVGVFPPSGELEVHADSNKLRETYIQLMSGTSAVNVDTIESLNVNDLRCIATYLSNFYVPYSTALDDEEHKEDSINYMVNSLKSIGFKDDSARTLVDAAYSASLSSAKQLYISAYDWEMAVRAQEGTQFPDGTKLAESAMTLGYNKNLQPAIRPDLVTENYKSYLGQPVECGDEKYYPVSIFIYTLLWEQIGRYYDYMGYNEDVPGDVAISLYFGDSSKMTKCFEYNMLTCNFISRFNKAADLGDGMGGNHVITMDLAQWVQQKPKDKASTTTFTQKMYVDWVGNIIADYGDVRVIMYPGCINPVAFNTIDGSAPASSTEDESEEEGEEEEEEESESETETEAEEEEEEEEEQETTTATAGTKRPQWLEDMLASGEASQSEAGVWLTINNMPLERDGHKGYPTGKFNLISSWGQWFVNQNEGTGTAMFESSKEAVVKYDIKMIRGSNKTAVCDSSLWPFSGGDAADVTDFLGKASDEEAGSGLGLVTPSGWRNVWPGEVDFYMRPYKLTKENSLSSFLFYAPISSDTLKSLDTSEVFQVYDMFKQPLNKFNNDSKFSTSSEDFSSFMTFDAGDYEALRSFFLTYTFAYNNRKATKFEKSKHYVNMKFCSDNFPSSLDTSIVWDSLNTDDEKIVSFIYYLLHPVEGALYVATLFKNKVSGIIVSWHEDVVGGTDSNSTTGMSQYLNMTGYVTSPTLKELGWFDSLISNYYNIIVYLIILLCLILICYIITGHMSIGRAVVGVVLFSILAFLPPVAINAVTDKVNVICDTIYSEKFDYWAYSQLQSYISKLSSVERSSTVEDYFNRLVELKTNSEISSPHSYGGVKLKWMTPKKIHEGATASNEITNVFSNSNSGLSATMAGLVTTTQLSGNTGETYSDKVGALYLYRDFSDIFLYGVQSYNLYTAYGFGDVDDSLLTLPEAGKSGDNIGVYWSDRTKCGHISYSTGEPLGHYILSNQENDSNTDSLPTYITDTSSINAIRKGFMNNNVGLEEGDTANYYVQNGGLAVGLLVRFNGVLTQVYDNLDNLRLDLEIPDDNFNHMSTDRDTYDITVEDMKKGKIFYGLEPSTFDYSLMDFTKDNNKVSDDGNGRDTSQKFEDLSGFYYALYSESPYYFFNYNFRDYITTHVSEYSYNKDNMGASSGHIHKALLKNKQEFFFNLSEDSGNGYGELKDFMGMHDLFYYIIPMLRDGCELVDLFDQAFGMKTNSDTSLMIGVDGKVHYNGEVYEDFAKLAEAEVSVKNDDGEFENVNLLESLTSEQLYKLWHDYNVWTLFQAYCPWIDTMEDCKYANAETIRVLGEPFVVRNPLDPTSYYSSDGDDIVEGRYMVFSRSEMAYYGLTEKDLTTVELKIIQTQDAVYKQTLDLMNYYTLADEVLINAFSMIQTFEFNKHFSESGVMGQSYILYPQGYEAKAFTYDAYLRLVIAESSGEPIQVDSATGDTSIYKRVISKTSLFFGIFLLINDVLSVYIMPCLKVAFLVMLFFISIALVIAASVKLELNIVSVVWKSILAPLGSYFCISVGFAWLVSLFMSNGAQGVVKTRQTISTGDPTTVIIVMIVINIATMILYFKLCKKCFKDLKTYILSVLDSISSNVVGAVKRVVGVAAAGKAYGQLKRIANNVSNTPRQRGIDNVSRSASPSNPSSLEAAIDKGRTSGGPGIGTAAAMGAAAGVTAGAASSLTSNAFNAALDEIGASAGDEAAAKGGNKYDSACKVADAKQAFAQKNYDRLSAQDKANSQARKDNSVEGRFKKRMDTANGQLNSAKSSLADAQENFQAFRNGNGMGLGQRISAGAHAVGYSAQAGMQAAGAGITAAGASLKAAPGMAVKGIGRKIDSATGNRISNFVYSDGVSRETAIAQNRLNKLSAESEQAHLNRAFHKASAKGKHNYAVQQRLSETSSNFHVLRNTKSA